MYRPIRHRADWRAARPASRIVATGFIARDRDSNDTTLGRNGSDHSAAIFANLFDAAELAIWTDVDGVLSADPRLVPDAMVLPTMSYAEACELAYFGAKVLHPQTMAPVQSRDIPLCIRNTLNPSAPGTWILARNPEGDAEPSPVKGLTIVRDMAVLELVGNGMVGVPGTAEKLFAALHRAVAVAEVEGPHAALMLVDALDLDRYYLFHAIRADLLRRLGRPSEATRAYAAAIERCDNAAERDFLLRRLQETHDP